MKKHISLLCLFVLAGASPMNATGTKVDKNALKVIKGGKMVKEDPLKAFALMNRLSDSISQKLPIKELGFFEKNYSQHMYLLLESAFFYNGSWHSPYLPPSKIENVPASFIKAYSAYAEKEAEAVKSAFEEGVGDKLVSGAFSDAVDFFLEYNSERKKVPVFNIGKTQDIIAGWKKQKGDAEDGILGVIRDNLGVSGDQQQDIDQLNIGNRRPEDHGAIILLALRWLKKEKGSSQSDKLLNVIKNYSDLCANKGYGELNDEDGEYHAKLKKHINSLKESPEFKSASAAVTIKDDTASAEQKIGAQLREIFEKDGGTPIKKIEAALNLFSKKSGDAFTSLSPNNYKVARAQMEAYMSAIDTFKADEKVFPETKFATAWLYIRAYLFLGKDNKDARNTMKQLRHYKNVKAQVEEGRKYLAEKGNDLQARNNEIGQVAENAGFSDPDNLARAKFNQELVALKEVGGSFKPKPFEFEITNAENYRNSLIAVAALMFILYLGQKLLFESDDNDGEDGDYDDEDGDDYDDDELEKTPK